jgi:hypothetical protein
MADQRAEGKKLIGAQASAELWAGVDAWLKKYPKKTVTDFVLGACLEKLKGEGIPVDEDGVLRDRRARQPNSSAERVRDDYFSGGKKVSYSRRRPSKKSAKQPRPAQGDLAKP